MTIALLLLSALLSLAVAAFCAGVETGFLSEIPDTAVRLNAEKSPLGRNLTVEDVVPAFTYLLSDGADAVTGVNLPVAPGLQG